MNIYQIDTAIQLNGSFINATNGAPIDPTVVTLVIEDPSGTLTTITSSIVRTGIGAYYYIFTPSGPGKWTYKWQGTGAAVATSRDTSFIVKASDLIPG